MTGHAGERRFGALGASGLSWSRAGYQLTLAAEALWEQVVAARLILSETSWAGEDVSPSHVRDLRADEQRTVERAAVDRVALMLLGLAIETTCKTILVDRDPEAAVVSGEFQHAGHDLIPLLGEAGVRLTQAECVEVQKLTDYVRWYGRYPIPLKDRPITLSDAYLRLDARGTDLTWQHGRAVLARGARLQNTLPRL